MGGRGKPGPCQGWDDWRATGRVCCGIRPAALWGAVPTAVPTWPGFLSTLPCSPQSLPGLSRGCFLNTSLSQEPSPPGLWVQNASETGCPEQGDRHGCAWSGGCSALSPVSVGLEQPLYFPETAPPRSCGATVLTAGPAEVPLRAARPRWCPASVRSAEVPAPPSAGPCASASPASPAPAQTPHAHCGRSHGGSGDHSDLSGHTEVSPPPWAQMQCRGARLGFPRVCLKAPMHPKFIGEC